MAFNDDKWGMVFPTRQGPSQGAGYENKILQGLGGADGIRTKITVNADGSVTMCRTRAGHPEFTTLPAKLATTFYCLPGPLEEKSVGEGVPVDMFLSRRWHDPIAPMVTTDGIYSIPRRPLKKWTALAGTDLPLKVVEFNFASSGVAAAAVDHIPDSLEVFESSAGRTWHPRELGRVVNRGIYFVMERLSTIALTHKGSTFTWSFSKVGDAGQTGSLPVCMNKPAKEGALTARTLFSVGLKKTSLYVSPASAGDVIAAAPGGLLAAMDSPPTDLGRQDQAVVSDVDGQSLTDLSQVQYAGQPWHGWMDAIGVNTNADPVNFPAGLRVTPPDYVLPSDYGGGDTHYFAVPGLPDIPDAGDLPAGFALAGKQFLKDAVLFGKTKCYSPEGNYGIGGASWLHTGPDGIHVLAMTYTDKTLTSATLHFWNTGKLTSSGVVGTPVEIATVAITSPDMSAWLGASTYKVARSALPPDSYGVAHYGSDQAYNNSINTSPTGNKAVVAFYVYLDLNYDRYPNGGALVPIMTKAWEFVVQDNLVDYTFTEVWSFALDTFDFRPACHYHYVDYLSAFLKKQWAYPGGTSFTAPTYAVPYRVHYIVNRRGPYASSPESMPTAEMAIMAAYSKAGDLVITKVRKEWVQSELPGFTDVPITTWYPNAWPYIDGEPGGVLGTQDPDYLEYMGMVSNPLAGQVSRTWTSTTRTVNPDYAISTQTYTGVDRLGPPNSPQDLAHLSNNLRMCSQLTVVGTEYAASAASLGFVPIYPAKTYGAYDPRNRVAKLSTQPIGYV